MKIVLFAIFIALLAKALYSTSSNQCLQHCGNGIENRIEISYPFGFSSGCPIQLNCSNNRDIRIGEFLIRNITDDNILIHMPSRCNRQIDKIKQLITPNHALTYRNNLLLQNCSSLPLSDCVVPSNLLNSNFPVEGCESMINDSLSCFSQNNILTDFIDYDTVARTPCTILFSSVGANLNNNGDTNSTVSLEIQILELGWWLNGTCRCVDSATCTNVTSLDGGIGYRCRCREGFEGDGYTDGKGCRKGRSKFWLKHRIGLSISMVVGIMIIFMVVVFFYRERLRFIAEKNKNVEAFLTLDGSLAPKRYSYYDIRKMTNSFADKLGEGGYGSVFKGKLLDGCFVAVKVLTDDANSTNGGDFVNEVASISRTSHVNIVTLLGFCLERNKRALIYEFMSNKSLDKFIRKSVESSFSLDLETLYKIAVGTARGLEYLHRGCNTRIVHFDIKPENILLDEDFSPKISGFGLAKLCKRKQSVVSMIGARGTPGYIAPEVFSRTFGEVSHKSDVYSYGMMVINMVGIGERKDCSMESTKSDMYFLDFIYKRLEVMSEDVEEVKAKKMVLVSLWCIQTNPLDRPSMGKVVDMLEGDIDSIQIPPKPILFAQALVNEGSCSPQSSSYETKLLDT